MPHRRLLFSGVLGIAGFVLAFSPQQAGSATPQSNSPSDSAANPEIARVYQAFAGDWDTTETMERSEFFPNGGGRTGKAHFRLADGGHVVVEEGHSSGSAGELHFVIVIWWDKPAQLYRFFTCFNGEKNPCRVRGTAHWEGDAFVNDYEETEKDKKVKYRDSFAQWTPDSFTLVAGSVAENGTLKPLITTKYIRKR